MTREELISRIKNEGCYEAVYDDSEGRQIVVIRGLELYAFVQNLIKEEREACAKLVEADGLARGAEGFALIKAAIRIRARNEAI